ncbi:hypothetical protein M758_4G235100 [Ceratodon purpureus]|nr:hypothetical protein M758_4G235100 [Ceratodon purpureus]
MSTLYYIVVGSEDELPRFRGRESAPLERVSVSGVIRDTVAQYTLEQTYVNPRTDATIEAVYSFPLYEGVAVSGFEAEVDCRKIVGRVQEKVAARKEYEEAVQAGKVASLLEQERPDVFQASIGNIPPAKKICIRITLVSAIKQDADENQVRFVLPTAIAPRYGAGPVSTSNVNSSASKLSVSMACAMSKPITSIQSPSHTMAVHLGSSSSEDSSSPVSFEPNRARVSLTADSLLDKDLVIIIQSPGLDAPRALVERHPTDGTHAVSLTFAPRFALNPLRGSELIFLVDRSGSMMGPQMQQAGQALELFLRSIPFEDHSFNIIGFGSTHKALFPKSAAYNEESLKKGISYAQQLQADMGGTEMTGAFQEAFQRRRRDVPTQIFLLTDGEIWDVDNLVQVVREAVEEGEKSDSFVRVFSLGVGASVSHHLIESVARAGSGYAQLVVEGERMEKKVVGMLKAALMPPVTNVSVQWTSEATPAPAVEDANEEDFEMVEASGESKAVPAPSEDKPTINLFDTSPELVSPPPPPPTPLPNIVIAVNQAPFKVPALYRGARFTIYAILSSTTPVPKELVLRGSSPDGPVELKVAVEPVHEGETMLHALAARTLVRDLEEGSSCIHALGRATTETNEQMLRRLGVQVVTQEGKKYNDLPFSSNLVFDITKQKILDLALKYDLSSKYTSWVAIDTESQQRIIQDEDKNVIAAGLSKRACINLAGRSSAMSFSGKSRSRLMEVRAPAASFSQQQQQLQLQQLISAVAAKPSGSGHGVQQSAVYLPHAPQGRAGLLEAGRSFMRKRSDRSRGIEQDTARSWNCSSPDVGPALMELSCASHGLDVRKESAIGLAEPAMDRKEGGLYSGPHARLRSILQHQRFDGLFPLNSEVAFLLSTTVEDLQGKLGELRKGSGVELSEAEWEMVWATCLAVELMRKQLPELQEEWELVVEKAEKRVAALVKSPQDVAALQQAASKLLQAVSKTDH